jgi:hypothetical protein
MLKQETWKVGQLCESNIDQGTKKSVKCPTDITGTQEESAHAHEHQPSLVLTIYTGVFLNILSHRLAKNFTDLNACLSNTSQLINQQLN